MEKEKRLSMLELDKKEIKKLGLSKLIKVKW